jgi:hypothetical protein
MPANVWHMTMVESIRVLQTPSFRKAVKKLTLPGYSFDQGALVLALLALGSHENFYRDL